MKIFKLLFLLIVLGGGVGFGYVAFTDVDIQQEEQTIEIPNERFFGTSDS